MKIRFMGFLYISSGERLISLLDENPVRAIYDVSEGGISVCRVVKQLDKGIVKWLGTCGGKDDVHIPMVRECLDLGKILPKETKILDSLRTKGPKQFHKNIMHKPTPRISRPRQVSKPQGDPRMEVVEKR